jgi:hypothetical protein
MPAASPAAISPATIQHSSVDTANAGNQTTISVLEGNRETLQPSEMKLSGLNGPETPRQLLPAASQTSDGGVASSSGRYGRAGSGGQGSALGGALRRVGRALSAGRPAAPDRWANHSILPHACTCMPCWANLQLHCGNAWCTCGWSEHLYKLAGLILWRWSTA